MMFSIILLLVFALPFCSAIVWALKVFGYPSDREASSESEFVSWMAKYYCEYTPIGFDAARHEAFSSYKEFMKDEGIEFGNSLYGWTQYDAEILTTELLLLD